MPAGRFLDGFLKGHLALRPLERVWLGLPGDAGALEDLSPGGLAKQTPFYRESAAYAARLRRAAPGRFAPELRCVERICAFNLRLLASGEHGFDAELAADLYETLCAQRMQARTKNDRAALRERLEASPPFLEALAENLLSIRRERGRPALDGRRLADAAGALEAAGRDLGAAFAKEHGAPARAAGRAFRDLAKVVRRLAPGARESFALGAPEYAFRLKTALGVSSPPRLVYESWRRETAKIVRRMERLAKRISPRETLAEVLERLGKTAPADAREALAVYRRLTDRSQRFVRRRRLFRAPPGYRLRVEPVPPGLGAAITTAMYFPAPPFDPRKKGIFLVALGARERLAAHNPFHAAATAVHEAFPGHDMQFDQWQRRRGRIHPVRFLPGDPRNWGTSLNIEGYAHYAEHLMLEEGFFTDEEALFALAAQAWRAARVVVDAGLHCRWLSFEEAVRYLRWASGLDEATARGEVFRYTKWPTQAVTYALGKAQILKLKARARRRKGRAFREADFHARLLDEGPILPSEMSL